MHNEKVVTKKNFSCWCCCCVRCWSFSRIFRFSKKRKNTILLFTMMNSFAISLLIITFVSANADSKKVSVRLGLMSGCPCTAQVCICDLSFRLRTNDVSHNSSFTISNDLWWMTRNFGIKWILHKYGQQHHMNPRTKQHAFTVKKNVTSKRIWFVRRNSLATKTHFYGTSVWTETATETTNKWNPARPNMSILRTIRWWKHADTVHLGLDSSMTTWNLVPRPLLDKTCCWKTLRSSTLSMDFKAFLWSKSTEKS